MQESHLGHIEQMDQKLKGLQKTLHQQTSSLPRTYQYQIRFSQFKYYFKIIEILSNVSFAHQVTTFGRLEKLSPDFIFFSCTLNQMSLFLATQSYFSSEYSMAVGIKFYHFCHRRLDIRMEYTPPLLQELRGVVLIHIGLSLSLYIKFHMPRLGGANKMNNFDIVTISILWTKKIHKISAKNYQLSFL